MAPAIAKYLRIADFAIGGTLKFTVRDKDFGTKDRRGNLKISPCFEEEKSSSKPSCFGSILTFRGVHILSPAAEKGEGQIGKMSSFRESSEWGLNGNE